ncbi:MAG: sugar transferase [Terracidiphilus sp.]|jgi:lipopolysaccharide/colanic/teichoic acid biosynthesis glycosyltransferase
MGLIESKSIGETRPMRMSRFAAAIKRLIDILGSACGLVLLFPLFVFLGLLVKIDSDGPAIYRRRVVGPKGEFDAFKFRSMCNKAEAKLQANPRLLAEFAKNYKLVNDPRVTRVGRILRITSLDELPQLLNVLLGQMSLIGPRMITLAELSKYGRYSEIMLSVRPGMSGYWQTEGRQKTSYEERVQMDLFYIQNWSLAFDMKILAKTPWKVLKREGAH